MRVGNFSTWSMVVALVALTLLETGARATAQTETLLYSFEPNYGHDADIPYSGLVFDTAGNLYGTTYFGGVYNRGAVFELSPQRGGGWTETVLHSFRPNLKDGIFPYAGLIVDGAGNLYGTTTFGGTYGQGTVFELSPQAGGGWTETILHSFDPSNGQDGESPYAGVILDAGGNLYGGTQRGGGTAACRFSFGCGVIFKLTPDGQGNWTETILHVFQGPDGAELAGLTFGPAGNIYGTTTRGGAQGCGTVFELTTAGTGGWTQKILHSFSGHTDGCFPNGGIVIDPSGSFYGMTSNGTVFRIRPGANGNWTASVLYSFPAYSGDGVEPVAGLVRDVAGNLYGTTVLGGNVVCSNGGEGGCGIVFELSPQADGSWTEKVVRNFGGGTDGQYPHDSLILDATGNLFGTTAYGGTGVYGGVGIVFEITP